MKIVFSAVAGAVVLIAVKFGRHYGSDDVKGGLFLIGVVVGVILLMVNLPRLRAEQAEVNKLPFWFRNSPLRLAFPGQDFEDRQHKTAAIVAFVLIIGVFAGFVGNCARYAFMPY